MSEEIDRVDVLYETLAAHEIQALEELAGDSILHPKVPTTARVEAEDCAKRCATIVHNARWRTTRLWEAADALGDEHRLPSWLEGMLG